MAPTLIAISIFILGILILVHELGHFLIARWSGVRILRFSIGFGPTLWRWRRGETEYALSAIPLGGYVKMAGEQREDQQYQPWEFLSKPLGTRAFIVFAGPLVNYAFAAVVFWAVCIPQALPVVGRVAEGSPAQSAGLQVGDRVIAIDGRSIESWDGLTKIVHPAAGRSLEVVVDREGSRQRLTVIPRAEVIADSSGRQRSIGRMGIEPQFRMAPLAAIGESFSLQGEMFVGIFKGLWLLVTGQASLRESLTGPIGIIIMTSNAVQSGFASLLFFVGILSFSLAIFNLFPFPVLDGGHLLFMGLEKLLGRPVSPVVQERAAQVSLTFLITLVVLICVNDVKRFELIEKIVEWWRR